MVFVVDNVAVGFPYPFPVLRFPLSVPFYQCSKLTRLFNRLLPVIYNVSKVRCYYDVNILGGSVHTEKKNAKGLVVATEEIGIEVNADKTKYMVMPRDRNARRGHSVKIDNSSI